MFKKFIAFFESYQLDDSNADDEQNAINKAVVFILLEVALADQKLDSNEICTLKQLLQDKKLANNQQVDEYLDELIKEHDWQLSIQPYTRLINEQFDEPQKIDLLKQCWQIAFADNELDKYEELRIRQLSDLLYLPHKDFIQTKLQVTKPE